jgi:hypothetical protein
MNQRLEELMTNVDPNLTKTALQRGEVNGDVQNNKAKSNVMKVLIYFCRQPEH